ncbi:sensor histidine kinase [Nakamurella sp. GG22]
MSRPTGLQRVVMGGGTGVPVTALTALAAGIGAVFTALVLAGWVRFEYRNTAAHLALETMIGGIALLVALLFYGRFRRRHDVQDLLTSQGLVLLAAAALTTTWLLLSPESASTGKLYVWLPLGLRVTGASFLAAGALVVESRRVPERWRRWSLVPPVAISVLLVLVLGSFAAELPVGLDPEMSPGSAADQLLTGHPVLIVAQGYLTLCFSTAAIAFSRQGGRRQEELLFWLGPACAVSALACLNYLLFPSIHSEWLYTGDFLRTAFYLLLLLGAVREISHYWASQAELAVMDDRRRLARELHDGVVQEVSYIKSEMRPFGRLDGPRSTRILGACDRALDEARQAIEAMGTSSAEPLGFTVHRAVRQVAERYDVAVEMDLDDTITATQDQRHSLLRIVREAVSNAARHGGAKKIRVRLAQDLPDGRRIVITDNGTGFDVEKAHQVRNGYGLISMRERAENLPGSFHLDSGPTGTTVTVQW